MFGCKKRMTRTHPPPTHTHTGRPQQLLAVADGHFLPPGQGSRHEPRRRRGRGRSALRGRVPRRRGRGRGRGLQRRQRHRLRRPVRGRLRLLLRYLQHRKRLDRLVRRQAGGEAGGKLPSVRAAHAGCGQRVGQVPARLPGDVRARGGRLGLRGPHNLGGARYAHPEGRGALLVWEPGCPAVP